MASPGGDWFWGTEDGRRPNSSWPQTSYCQATLQRALLRRYFAVEAPFEDNARKKSEFPDGFALLSLETVAQQEKKLILCVSMDKGWHSFATESEFLVCVTDLNVALSYFNDSGRTTADQTMALWRSGAAVDLIEEVEHAFEYRLGDTDFNPDGASGIEFESEPISAVMQSVDLETASDPIVIDAEDDSITFIIDVEALVAFEAKFSFFVKDWVDKDYVNLGSAYFSTEERVEFQLAITVLRDFDTQPQIVEVQVAKIRIEVDFGYVEPFQEDPTHEKY